MVDLIHIGDYKTGTSWIQREIFLKHPEIAYLDWPESNPGAVRFFSELVDGRDLDYNEIALRQLFQLQIKKIQEEGRKIVISREALAGEIFSGENARRTAERLFGVFGPTPILLVVREQFSMIASLYSQFIKMGGGLSLKDYIFDPLYSKHLVGRLQYEKLIDTYVEIFGKDNVTVWLHEAMREDNQEFLKQIYSIIGCKNRTFVPDAGHLVNPSLTVPGVMIQRFLNYFCRTRLSPAASILPLDKIIALLLRQPQKERLIKSAKVQMPFSCTALTEEAYLLYSINMGLNLKFSEFTERFNFGRKISVPLEIRKKLAPLFVAGNRKLVSSYGLNLPKYGWVL